MSLLFPPANPPGVPRTWHAYLNQGEWWKTQADEWVRIADMTPGHRANAAALMQRAAASIEMRYGISMLGLYANAPDDVIDAFLVEDARRQGDPERWIRSTVLYRALIAEVKKFDGAARDAS